MTEPAEDTETGSLADVVVLHDPLTHALEAREATEEVREQARNAARERRAVFEHRTKGADTRAGMLPRAKLASLAGAAAVLMAQKVIQEEVVPSSVKEAAEAAKVFAQIARDQLGEPRDGRHFTPEERDKKLETVENLETTLAERAAKASDVALAGAPEDGGLDPNEWDLDEPSAEEDDS